MRVDSTEGTANSLQLSEQDGGAAQGEIRRRRADGQTRNVVEVKGTKYTVTHSVFRFEDGGRKKTVIVEGRGNDPWVPAIEGNRVDELGASLVADSLEASRLATKKARSEVRRGRTSWQGSSRARAAPAGLQHALLHALSRDEGGARKAI